MKKIIFAVNLTLISPCLFAGPPILLDRQIGKYLGTLSNNRYDPDSVANPYGRYGSKYFPDSIKNPYSKYTARAIAMIQSIILAPQIRQSVFG